MKPFTWTEGMTAEETKNGAYWERNMLALLLANALIHSGSDTVNGWYKHEGDGFEGWGRVISIGDGKLTFHIPDDFDLGVLPEIEPNWNGHTTEEKWILAMNACGIIPEKELDTEIPFVKYNTETEKNVALEGAELLRKAFQKLE